MDYKSVFTNLCLELQQNRSWIKGLGKNPQKSELIHWRQCLLSGGTEACSLGLRETPACIHVIQRLSQPRVACWHGFRQNSQKTLKKLSKNGMRVYTLSDRRSKKKLRVYTASEAKGLRSIKDIPFWYFLLTRAFAKPPKLVQMVCECIVVLRGIREVSWKSAKAMMAETNFLKSLTEMDVDGIGQTQVSCQIHVCFLRLMAWWSTLSNIGCDLSDHL